MTSGREPLRFNSHRQPAETRQAPSEPSLPDTLALDPAPDFQGDTDASAAQAIPDLHTARADDAHDSDGELSPESLDLSDSAVRPVSVYMPRSTFEALRQTVVSRDMDYTSLVIEALNLHAATVAPQFRARGTSSDQTMPVRATRRRRGEGLEHIQLRLDGRQREWLAARVAESGAPSRAAFVSAVLNEHLGIQTG